MIHLPKTYIRLTPDSVWPLRLTPTREPTKARVTMREWRERKHRRNA